MRLKQVRALVLDVDGVMTDGGVYISAGGETMKRFDIKDGAGLVHVQRAGVRVAILSLEPGGIPEVRAKKLGITDIFTGVEDKLATLQEFMKRHDFKPRDVAYVGDDITDLLAMNFVGAAIAPADAHLQVRRAADWVTKAPGGRGAIREITDAILKARADSGR